MTLQAIRRFFEAPIETAIHSVDPEIPVLVDNQTYLDNDAATEFALIRVSFGEVIEPTIGDPVEHVRGVVVVEVYTPKGTGPGRAQELATAVSQAAATFPRLGISFGSNMVRGSITSLVGPSFTPLDGRPHLMTRLSFGFQASYT